MIAKRKQSLYVPGERSDDWQKLKLENHQEFVIGGYRPGGAGIDALLVGYYDDSGLRFAGKVRAAFLGLRSDKSAREVRREWPGLSGG